MAKAKTKIVEKDILDIPYIAEQLRCLAVPIETVYQDPENARFHTPKNLEQIKISLSRFGQDQPLVVRASDRIIVKGNGRHMVGVGLGWKYIAVVLVDDSQAEAIARSLADNRSSDLAEWDENILGRLFLVLDQNYEENLLPFTGFVGSEVWDRIVSKQPEEPEEPEEQDSDESDRDISPTDREQQRPISNPPASSSNGTFSILIQCRDEEHQKELIEQFKEDNLDCRALNKD